MLISFLSFMITAIVIFRTFPDALTNQNAFRFDTAPEDFTADDDRLLYFQNLYMVPYTRISPYVFGMWIAYLHVNNQNYDFCKGNGIKEWICFLTCIMGAAIGGGPKSDSWNGILLPPIP